MRRALAKVKAANPIKARKNVVRWFSLHLLAPTIYCALVNLEQKFAFIVLHIIFNPAIPGSVSKSNEKQIEEGSAFDDSYMLDEVGTVTYSVEQDAAVRLPTCASRFP